jgi:chitinase
MNNSSKLHQSRIIFYYQTFTGLKDILHEDTKVTHIHLSSTHFGLNNDNSPYIHLNDYPPTNKIFNNVWSEIKQAQELGIKVVLMVGGAGGAFSELFRNFETYYEFLKKLIIEKNLDGIDLDVEEYINLTDIQMMIKRINADFGDDFIISMAPVQSSLENDSPGMGGFIYKDLYNSNVGHMIHYFNVQAYYDYSFDSFKQIVNNGYQEEQLVMGSLSYQNSGDCFEQIKKISETYNIGGVFNWEYFDINPKGNEWANNMDLILNSSNKDNLDRIIETLDTGDLILFSGNVGIIDTIIKFFTWSKWTHVGIVLKDPTYISEDLKGHYLLECGYNDFENVDHNTRYGVQIVDLKEKLSTFEGEVYYRKIKPDFKNRIINLEQKIQLSYFSIQDKPYDLNLIDFLFMTLKFNKKIEYNNVILQYLSTYFFNHRKMDAFVCSSLVGYIYVELGLLPRHINWSQCEPVTFSEDDDDPLIDFLTKQKRIFIE